MQRVDLYTIGFTKKSAEQFFTRLQQGGVRRVVDVRLHNVSQLAGFAKREDLRYFLQAIGGIDYVHCLDLAPTADMLAEYKHGARDWPRYAERFVDLIARRQIETTLGRDLFDRACLLCSEAQETHCHRRLVADYLLGHWPDMTVTHLR